MTGIIGIEHLRIRCIIGVNPEERDAVQDIYIDLKVKTDFSKCGATDSIRDTVNYIHLQEACIHLAKSKRHRLMETLALDITTHLLKEFDIHWTWIRIKKPKAIGDAQFAIVEMEKSKKQ